MRCYGAAVGLSNAVCVQFFEGKELRLKQQSGLWGSYWGLYEVLWGSAMGLYEGLWGSCGAAVGLSSAL